jgi:hypothetical protein
MKFLIGLREKVGTVRLPLQENIHAEFHFRKSNGRAGRKGYCPAPDLQVQNR